MEMLFSYGTLQDEKVQLATFDRKLSGTKETLLGYKLSKVKITDKAVIKTSGKDIHPILKKSDNVEDIVEGTVFKLTSNELSQADGYEVEEYKRVSATLKSGLECWIYAER